MADQNVRDWTDIDPAFSSNVSWGRETGLSTAAVANVRIRLTAYPSWVRPIPAHWTLDSRDLATVGNRNCSGAAKVAIRKSLKICGLNLAIG
jgi:hypothetical protein